MMMKCSNYISGKNSSSVMAAGDPLNEDDDFTFAFD